MYTVPGIAFLWTLRIVAESQTILETPRSLRLAKSPPAYANFGKSFEMIQERMRRGSPLPGFVKWALLLPRELANVPRAAIRETAALPARFRQILKNTDGRDA